MVSPGYTEDEFGTVLKFAQFCLRYRVVLKQLTLPQIEVIIEDEKSLRANCFKVAALEIILTKEWICFSF